MFGDLTVAFDGDDTLWHTEDQFQATQRAFEDLLSPWAEASVVDDRLFEIETGNLPRFGYGAKSFTLSMIETAIDLSDGAIDAVAVTRIMELGKHLLDQPAVLLDGVLDTLDALAAQTLMIITKGDLHNQLAKVDSSGLRDRFWRVEVVAEKNVGTYADLLTRHELSAESFVMVGNSLKSDVLPVLDLGARAVHVPYDVTWRHEHADDHDTTHVPTIDNLRELPDLLADWV